MNGVRRSILALVALGAVVGNAADVPITATKLIVIDKLAAAGKSKVVYVSKDPDVTKGAGLHVEQIGVRLDIAYATGSVAGAFTIPRGTPYGWVVNKDALAKFVNKSAPSGATETKLALVKPGKQLKLVGKGLGDSPIDVLDAGAPVDPVHTAYCVDNAGEVACHCSQFASCVWKPIAGGTGAKLSCKEATGDGGCVASVCGQVTTCTDGDGCCPFGCGQGNDDDCTSCFVYGDLTVTDTCANLEWEKKDGLDGVQGYLAVEPGAMDPANPHDVDNLYSWAGSCTLDPDMLCQPNTAAATTCASQTGGAFGCAECGAGQGTCDVDSADEGAITTTWDWVNQVNAEAFAGHGDWRLPTSAGNELEPTGDPEEIGSLWMSSVDVCDGVTCVIHPWFGPHVNWLNWSASSSTPIRAWLENLGLAGSEATSGKIRSFWARAVRPAS